MLRFCRSHLSWIWCCAFLVVSSYVLFDLLDVDGSDFDQSPGSSLVAEEWTASEEAEHPVALGTAPLWLPCRYEGWAILQCVPTPTTRISHSILFHIHRRPRAALSAQDTSAPPPGSDPAEPVADL